MAMRFFVVILLSISLLTGCKPSSEPVAGLDDAAAERHPLQEFEERNDDPLTAAGDRYQRRLSADGTVPDGALLRAKEQRDAMTVTQFAGGGNPPLQWDWVGPGNIGGRIRPIVIHPTTPDIMYVGSASGGIWKTFDGGQSWNPLDDFLPSLSIADMVMHPDDPDTLYAATGEGFFETVEGSSNTAAVRGAGIFLSTNAGATWSQIPSTDNPDFYFVNRLEFDPSDSDTMLAATNTGIWRSTTAGTTWTHQATFHALDVKFHPGNANRVVAGIHGHDPTDGPFYSTNGGITWTQSATAAGARQEIAWAPNQPQTVYASVSEGGRIKIWRSTNGGQSYSLMTTGNGLQTWAGYNNTIRVDPVNSDLLIIGGVNLFRSTNGGINFSGVFGAVHADMHRIVDHPDFDGVNNKTVFFATDGGIWKTDDIYASSASSLNNNLGITQFYGGAINATTGQIVGGTQDNGTLFYAGDPQDWDHIFGGDGGYGAADPTTTAPYYYYGEVQRALIHRSTNGGNSSYIYNGANPIADAGGSQTNFIPFFMLDPNNSSRMLVACRRMWRSNNVRDANPDWESIKETIEPPGPGSRPDNKTEPNAHFAENSPYNISTLAVARGNSDVVWAGHNNGEVYYSTDGTSAIPTWTRVDENALNFPDRWISTIVIDSRDHQHVYVALMGWESDNVWETTDGGATWLDVSGNGASSIPDAPVSALAIHPHVPGLLYAGTDVGVFVSYDNGTTWQANNDTPGNVPVEQLIWQDDRTLLAVTHGRGMYLATESVLVPDSFELFEGRQTGGTLSGLFESDSDYLQLAHRRAFIQSIDVELKSTTTVALPGTFQFRIQSVLNGGQTGEIGQTVRLWNFDSNEFEVVDARAASTTDEAVLVSPTGDCSRFIQPGTGEVVARVAWKRRVVRRAFAWSVDIDEAVWLITE